MNDVGQSSGMGRLCTRVASSRSAEESALRAASDLRRRAALRASGLLDTPAEPGFDRLTRLAARLFNAPIALISLVDADRQFFKSSVGLPPPWDVLRETPLSHSFCKFVVADAAPLIVSDARTHPTLRDNPAIRDLGVAAYLGVPLVGAGGAVLGSLCAIDVVPRDWPEDAATILQDLAASVMTEIALRAEDGVRARTEDAYRRFHALVENSGDFIAMAGLDTRVSYVNPAGRALVGLNGPQQVVDTWLAEYLIDETLEVVMREAIPQASSRGQWSGEGRLRHFRTGQAIHVQMNIFLVRDHATGAPTGFAATFRDISERKRTENRRIEDEQRFRSSFDDAPIGMALIAPNDRVIKVNRALQEIVGHSEAELTEMGLTGISHPDDREASRALKDRALEGKSPGYQIEKRYIHKDGRTVWVFVNATLVRDAGGTPRYFIVQIQDTTLRMQIEEDLRRAKEEADASSRSKSEFLANMSHEVRTPMSAILGNADMLIDDELPPRERDRAIEAIHRSATHLLQIINDILDLSKIEAGRMELDPIACDPWRIVLDVISSLGVTAEEKSIRLAAAPLSTLPDRVAIDPTRARQILVNLVGNAIKFTPRGGDVAVRVAAEHSPEPGSRTVLLTFSVEDKGIGMTSEQRATLFRPFQQGDTSTTRKFGGTGLGLSITRLLVDAMGGTIEVASEPGRGSRFVVRVPVPLLGAGPSWWERPTAVASFITRVKEPARRPEKPRFPETRGDVLRGRVLLAEDSPDTQRVLLYHLNRAGLSVYLAENGRAAVEQGLRAPFDVVLMDMQMPELDGYAAAAELRRAGYNGPIIALTAHAMSDDREKCLAAGCSDYLTKPITPALLIETLAPFLARHDPPKPSPAESRADMDELVHEFEQRMRPRAEEIRAAFTTGDLARSRLLAHQTKGTSGMYGYPGISEAASLLEQAIARGNTTAQIVELIDHLGEVIRETLPESD